MGCENVPVSPGLSRLVCVPAFERSVSSAPFLRPGVIQLLGFSDLVRDSVLHRASG